MKLTVEWLGILDRTNVAPSRACGLLSLNGVRFLILSDVDPGEKVDTGFLIGLSACCGREVSDLPIDWKDHYSSVTEAMSKSDGLFCATCGVKVPVIAWRQFFDETRRTDFSDFLISWCDYASHNVLEPQLNASLFALEDIPPVPTDLRAFALPQIKRAVLLRDAIPLTDDMCNPYREFREKHYAAKNQPAIAETDT